jgi:hypothetical protein
VRYNQSAEKNRSRDGIKLRNGGTEMENNKKRLEDSFRCSMETTLEINCKKKKKVNFNYSVAQADYIFACHDVNGRGEISNLTFNMLIKSSQVKVRLKCRKS